MQLEDLSEILGSEPLVCVELYRCLAHANVSEHQPTIGEGGREELGGRGWDEKGQGKREFLFMSHSIANSVQITVST